MIKAAKTKAQIRAELEQQVEAFLQQGGHVADCQPGESGREGNQPWLKPPHIERTNEQQARTPVLSEIQAIEARRHSKKPTTTNRKSASKEKKTLITDDFGEPLRWVSD